MTKKFKLITNTGKENPADERHVLDAAVADDGTTSITLTEGAERGHKRTYDSYAAFEGDYIMEVAPDGHKYHPSDAYTVVWDSDPRYAKI